MWMPAVCSICHMRYFMRSPDDEICPTCRAKTENAQQPIKTQKTKPNIKKQNESRVEPNTPKKEQKEIKTKPKSIEKVCLTCGKVFSAKDNRTKYCSAECRYRYWRPGKKSITKTKKETVVYQKNALYVVQILIQYCRRKYIVRTFVQKQLIKTKNTCSKYV